MSYLLLPADEREFVQHLVAELGLKLLLDDLMPDGRPHVSMDPLTAIPRELPGPVYHGDPSVRQLLFWAPEIGDLVTLGDPGRATDPVSRIALAITMQAAEGRWRDVIDRSRSPLIAWSRCSWHRNGHLLPAPFGTGRSTREPTELHGLHRSITLWLRKGSMKLDPFEHSDHPPGVPVDRRPFVVWARPEAAAWVLSGGRVWPWNG